MDTVGEPDGKHFILEELRESLGQLYGHHPAVTVRHDGHRFGVAGDDILLEHGHGMLGGVAAALDGLAGSVRPGPVVVVGVGEQDFVTERTGTFDVRNLGSGVEAVVDDEAATNINK